jgi:hypothetical protein
MKDVMTIDLTLELTSKLTHFKELLFSHPYYHPHPPLPSLGPIAPDDRHEII